MASLYRALVFSARGLGQYLADGYDAAKLPPMDDRPANALAGKTIVITGGSRSIGLALGVECVSRGARVHVVCRSPESGAAAVETLRAAARYGGTCELHVVDLSSLAQTRALVERWTSGGGALHALVCNAGVMRHERTETAEGFEYNFAVNTLGTHVLIAGLRPVLGRTATSEASLGASGYAPRVVVVSSAGMLTEPLEIEDLEFKKHRKFDAVRQYARGKRHQVAMVERWARLEGEKSGRGHVGYYSMHPGWCETDGVASSLPKFHERMRGRLRTPAQGADTILYLLTEHANKLKTGEFYFDREPVSKHITGGFTGYAASAVDELVKKLDALATEGSVRGERGMLGVGRQGSHNSFMHLR